MELLLGQKVRHRYTNDLLWVLRKGNEQILCRTKDLREIWFYPHELEYIEECVVVVGGDSIADK